jgi:hypothetical protein
VKEDNTRLKQDLDVNKQEISNYKGEIELLSEKSRQLSSEMSIMNREHQSVIEKLQRDNQTLSIKLDNGMSCNYRFAFTDIFRTKGIETI